MISFKRCIIILLGVVIFNSNASLAASTGDASAQASQVSQSSSTSSPSNFDNDTDSALEDGWFDTDDDNSTISDAQVDQSDPSLAIEEAPDLLTLSRCVPDHNVNDQSNAITDDSISSPDAQSQTVLIGPLSMSDSRETLAEMRSARRPGCYNLKFWDFLKSQRKAGPIYACCHDQHCVGIDSSDSDGDEVVNNNEEASSDLSCYYLPQAISIPKGKIMGICAPSQLSDLCKDN